VQYPKPIVNIFCYLNIKNFVLVFDTLCCQGLDESGVSETDVKASSSQFNNQFC
jgi:hypothetical protein